MWAHTHEARKKKHSKEMEGIRCVYAEHAVLLMLERLLELEPTRDFAFNDQAAESTLGCDVWCYVPSQTYKDMFRPILPTRPPQAGQVLRLVVHSGLFVTSARRAFPRNCCCKPSKKNTGGGSLLFDHGKRTIPRCLSDITR